MTIVARSFSDTEIENPLLVRVREELVWDWFENVADLKAESMEVLNHNTEESKLVRQLLCCLNS